MRGELGNIWEEIECKQNPFSDNSKLISSVLNAQPRDKLQCKEYVKHAVGAHSFSSSFKAPDLDSLPLANICWWDPYHCDSISSTQPHMKWGHEPPCGDSRNCSGSVFECALHKQDDRLYHVRSWYSHLCSSHCWKQQDSWQNQKMKSQWGGLMKAYALKVAFQWSWNFWNAYQFFTPLSNKHWGKKYDKHIHLGWFKIEDCLVCMFFSIVQTGIWVGVSVSTDLLKICLCLSCIHTQLRIRAYAFTLFPGGLECQK